MISDSIYLDFILRNVPRVVTQIDRDPQSPTYGSCDRNHWHLKIRDFDSAILQQSGLVLALLYRLNFAGNRFFANPLVRGWAEAALRYWCKIQLRDGSFNEYYPHEHGFPPTAFSLYSACESYKCLGIDDAGIREHIQKTARYLCRAVEEKACNQEIASIAALCGAYGILKEDWIKTGYEAKLRRLLALNWSEGWFAEYGGADTGYLSVSLDMLGEVYLLSGEERVKQPIHAVCAFLAHFIHPNGTAGGEYGARNTTYFLPAGLETAILLGDEYAPAIKQALFGGSMERDYFQNAVDDRYFSHYLLHSFLRAMRREQETPPPTAARALPFATMDSAAYFPQAGLISYHNARYSAYVGLKKGGVLKLYTRQGNEYVNCGYRVDHGGHRVAATNWQDDAYEIGYDGTSASVKGYMNLVSIKVSKPILHLGLRVVSAVLGSRIIALLKNKLIFAGKHSNVQFERSIRFTPAQVIVLDRLRAPEPVRFMYATNMSLRHVASGKFYASSDLAAPENGALPQQSRDVIIETVYDMENGAAHTQIKQM